MSGNSVAPEPDEPHGLMTTEEVARLLRKTPRTIRNYSRRGLLTPIRLTSRTTLYDASDVARFIRESTSGRA